MPTQPLPISASVARRFILGKSGLWPGRRWQGAEGAVAAIHAIGAVQIDPLLVTVRNHDLKLHSRVIGYSASLLNTLAYTERRFFDYGGLLYIYPMDELPHWRLHMRRHLDDPHWIEYFEANRSVVDDVRTIVAERGAIGHRDLEGNARVQNYRARKDTGLALYALWRIGELMTSGRRGFDRLYDQTARIAPAHLQHASPDDEAEAFFALKAITMDGLPGFGEWRSQFAYFVRRPLSIVEAKERLAALVASGVVTAVQVEGKRDLHYLPTTELPHLDSLLAGRIPVDWTPLESTTDQQVTFLAPLDPVSARGRAAKVFDGFEYKWEVYTPAPKRRWGYYVLPILYGDSLVARADLKFDRPAKTLRVLSFHLEKPETGKDSVFTAALARGLSAFARDLGAESLDRDAISPVALRAAKLYKPFGY